MVIVHQPVSESLPPPLSLQEIHLLHLTHCQFHHQGPLRIQLLQSSSHHGASELMSLQAGKRDCRMENSAINLADKLMEACYVHPAVLV